MTAKKDGNGANANVDTPEAIEEIRSLIEGQGLDVITVDTSIFDANKQRLDRGLFEKLEQFGTHPVQLVISDVVYREIKKHLIESISSTQSKFSKDMLSVCEFVGGDIAEVNALKEKLDAMPIPQEQAELQLKRFVANSGAAILQAGSHVKTSELVDLYFNEEPPFHLSNSKKSEFPDAIALITLEHWAEENDKNVLVVSGDGDWREFCKQSKRLHLLKDLAVALDLFQTPENIAIQMLVLLEEEIQTAGSDFEKELSLIVGTFNWDQLVSLDAICERYDFEIEDITVDKLSYALPAPYGNIKLTEISDSSVSVAFHLNVSIVFSVMIAFDIWVEQEEDYAHVGSKAFPVEKDFDMLVLATIPLQKDGEESRYIEIQPPHIRIELGSVEPTIL